MSLAILAESTDWVETARRYLNLIQLGFRLRESVFLSGAGPECVVAMMYFAT
jgi:hypothetical protein